MAIFPDLVVMLWWIFVVYMVKNAHKNIE